MYTNDFADDIVRDNFEHWLDEAVRTGERGSHLQPVTPLSVQTWQAIDAVADAVAAIGDAAVRDARLQAAIAAARDEVDRQIERTHHTPHVEVHRAAS
ncbi:hypothetical protein E4P42_11710 [Mycobacterium sp. PS03-16]|nr:hypothetical protein E4P42_11710 [Mycobacterium sp. PS03-16]